MNNQKQKKIKAWCLLVDGEIKDIYWKKPDMESKDFSFAKEVYEILLHAELQVTPCEIIVIPPQKTLQATQKKV